MQNITIHRYRNEQTRRFWQGWIEPEDGSWMLFVPGPDASTDVPLLHVPSEAEEMPQNIPAVAPLRSPEGLPLSPGKVEAND